MKNLLRVFCRLFNLNVDKNQRYTVISIILSGVLGTYIAPTLTKEIITALPSQWIAIQALVSSAFGIFAGKVWTGRVRKKVLKYFIYLILTESIAGFLLGMYLALIKWNVLVYAIAYLIYTNLITTFVCKCVMVYKTILWKDREREIYDNNLDIVSGFVCILGFGTSLIVMPSLKTALIIWSITCILDDFGWGIVYLKNSDKLKNIE